MWRDGGAGAAHCSFCRRQEQRSAGLRFRLWEEMLDIQDPLKRLSLESLWRRHPWCLVWDFKLFLFPLESEQIPHWSWTCCSQLCSPAVSLLHFIRGVLSVRRGPASVWHPEQMIPEQHQQESWITVLLGAALLHLWGESPVSRKKVFIWEQFGDFLLTDSNSAILLLTRSSQSSPDLISCFLQKPSEVRTLQLLVSVDTWTLLNTGPQKQVGGFRKELCWYL